MSSRPRRPGLLQALLLAACLLAAQWVGVGHRVDHHAPSAAHGAVASTGGHAHDGHAPGSAECLLIDHALAQADAWFPSLALPLAALRQAAPERTAAAAVLAAAAVPYLARGPPPARA